MGCVGTTIGWGNLKESKADLDALHKMNDDNLGRYRVMRVIAFGHYRNDLFRLAKHISVLAIGLLACVIPPMSSTQHGVTPTGIVITGGLFTIVLLLIMASALDRRQRDAIDEMDEAREVAKERKND